MSDLCCSINISTCWFCCSLDEKIFHNKVNICFGFTFAHLSAILFVIYVSHPGKLGLVILRMFQICDNLDNFI